jgi:hypothetical protein
LLEGPEAALASLTAFILYGYAMVIVHAIDSELEVQSI